MDDLDPERLKQDIKDLQKEVQMRDSMIEANKNTIKKIEALNDTYKSQRDDYNKKYLKIYDESEKLKKTLKTAQKDLTLIKSKY